MLRTSTRWRRPSERKTTASTDRRRKADQDDYIALVDRIFHATYGDTDLDGDVDVHDFAKLKQGLGKMNAGWADGDFNGDGIVNSSDFDMLVYNFGAQSAPLTKRNS